MTDTAPPALGTGSAPRTGRDGATLFPLLITLALTAVVAAAIRGADIVGFAMAGLWGDIVHGVPSGGDPTHLGPVVATLGTTAALCAIYAGLVRLRLLDDVRETPLALGLVGRDLPFLVAGLVFVALYASLADGLTRAAGLAVPPAPTHPLTLLCAILVLPLALELVLRGSLLPSLERQTGTAAAIVLTALAGLPATSPVPELIALALVPQLFFGWMAWSCRSLGSAAVLHAAYIALRLVLAG